MSGSAGTRPPSPTRRLELGLKSLVGPYFWIPSYLALGLGFVLPGEDWSVLSPLVPVLLGGILFFSCLRIPFASVRGAVCDRSRWGRVAWLGALKLLAIPLAAWGLTRLVAPEWAAGVLLVVAMPAGLSSIALTDLQRGSAVLALLLVVATSLLSPLTVPGLLAVFAGGAPDALAVAGRALYILALLAVPFALAQGVRAAVPALVARHHHRWGRGAITCSVLLVLTAVLVARPAWRGFAPADFLLPLGLVVGATLVTWGAALLAARRLPQDESVAFACAALYMNNGLAVAFAARFFPGQAHMLLPAVAMQVPMIGAVALLGLMPRRPAAPHQR